MFLWNNTNCLSLLITEFARLSSFIQHDKLFMQISSVELVHAMSHLVDVIHFILVQLVLAYFI